jgi:SAM-dependent methyltransferase
MATEPTTKSSEVEALHRRLEALEREHEERTALANAALAAAQDRSYWLDRWHVDLNALMRKPIAGRVRVALRALRGVYRFLYDGRTLIRAHVESVPRRLDEVREVAAEERAAAEGFDEQRFRRTLSPSPLHASPVTDLLYERMSEDDVRAVEARLDPPDAALWETASPADRKRLALAFAAHYGVQPALGRAGLQPASPPPGVHSMAGGSVAAGGSTYYADLVVDALQKTGFVLGSGQAGLDFGCSSGRVVRVLAAAYPDIDWHGCDPIPDAIEWASEHLAGVRFAHSPEYPPLLYGDRAFDIVFAISIWSHFSEQAGLDWLREMSRLIKPGGRLVLTAHGEQTIVHTHRVGARSVEQLEEIREALFEHGFWYSPEFGEAGDHGVANPDWGTAFLTPEWLLTRLTPAWRLRLLRPGRVEDNQDLYVLDRV